MPIDFKKELNEEQYKAVTEGNGPALVLAGAGSGKTRTLTYRVAYLIEQGVSPENILLVTFTNKAAREMLERVESILQKYPKGIWGGTFHHIGNRLLRKYATTLDYKNNFAILDREDSLVLMKQCYDELVDANKKSRYFPKANIIHNLNGYARNKGIGIKELMRENYDYLEGRELDLAESVANYYYEKKKLANSMDFDDLLINWLKLLTGNSNIREKLSSQFQYILVDEYQDTNKIQDSIIKILAAKNKNIMAVGDDSQSIYSFRAAEISNILDFPKEFPDTKIYKLEINYRSTPQILKLANSSIMNNKNKFVKNLKSIKQDHIKPKFTVNQNNRDQAKFVAQEINKLFEAGEDPQEIAVLFRSVFQALELELELNRKGISYIIRGGIRFFEQKHIKDVISYLKILSNHKDELAWKRILMLQEGIGMQTAEKIFKEIKKLSNLNEAVDNFEFQGSDKVKRGINAIKNIFKDLRNIEGNIIRNSIKIILKNGYSGYLKSNFDNHIERTDDLNQLGDFSEEYENLDEFLSEIALSEAFKNKQGTNRDVIQVQNKDQDKIILSTIHQAKGLEWNNVFVIGLAEGQFPHRRVYDNPREIEEERRLFYVAATRARNNLHLTFPAINSSNEAINQASTFIQELSESLFEKGINGGEFEDLPIIEYESK